MKESRSRVLTLYYHRVNSLENDYNQLCVSPIKFRQQMLYLKSHYFITRFEDDWSLLDGDSVAITFDDGYADNLDYAVPILEELEIPATIFVSTGSMNQERELWWDELERLLLIGNSFPDTFCLEDHEFACEWQTTSKELRENCYNAIHYLMKNLISMEKREEWLKQLWTWRGLNIGIRKKYRTLSESDCRKLAESKVISIGAHTISHPSLAHLDINSQQKEIIMSVDKLSTIIQRKVTIFSYPFGKLDIDFDKSTIDICRKAGIQKAASTEYALWNYYTDSFAVPRKIVRDWNLFEFADRVKDYWQE